MTLEQTEREVLIRRTGDVECEGHDGCEIAQVGINAVGGYRSWTGLFLDEFGELANQRFRVMEGARGQQAAGGGFDHLVIQLQVRVQHGPELITLTGLLSEQRPRCDL